MTRSVAFDVEACQANDPLGEHVHDERDVAEPGPRPDICEVGDPDPVRRRRCEVPVQQVAGPHAVLGRDRGPGALVAAHPGQAQQAHRTVHRPGRRCGDQGAPQVGRHLATPIQTLRGQPAHPVLVEGPGDLLHRVHDQRVAHGPGRDRSTGLIPGPVGPRGDLAALLAQDPADRLDRVALAALDVDEAHHQRLRGSSSPAKKTVAAFKIALSSSSRRTAALSALISASSALVGPCRSPESTWACSTHRRTLSPPTPSFLATAADAAVNDAYSCWCSVTIRTARTFSSGSIFFGMTSSSWTQTGAAPNPGRFSVPLTRSAAASADCLVPS